MFEFGAALPILLRNLGVRADDQHLKLFERHVVILGYMTSKRIQQHYVASVCKETTAIAKDIISLYGPEFRKPKQHFSQHIDLTFQRYYTYNNS